MTGYWIRTIRLSALAAVLFAGVAPAQEIERDGGFLERLFGGSERNAAGQEQAPATGPRVAPSSAADMTMRIDRLEAQIRQLTGAIEQLQFRNQQLEGQIKRMQQDGDTRFQESAGGVQPRVAAPAGPATAPPAVVTPPAVTAGRRGDAFDPAINPNAPGAPRTLGATTGNVAPAQMPDADAPVGVPGGRAAGAPLDLATLAGAVANPSPRDELAPPRNPGAAGAQVATLPPSASPKDAYDLAYGYIMRKDYALAEDGFRGFLQRFPSDRLVSDAYYWLGESLFQRQRFRDAAEVFLNVSTQHETAAKAPEALLRLGQSLAAMGEKEAACASFGETLRKYPRASIAVRQGVSREQKRAGC